MKKFMMLVVLFFMTSFFTEKEAANVNINFGVFYSSLNPYGDWIRIDNNVVWRPYDVGDNWSPYTAGRWEYTPDGWYWDSYESFGWATYHYGRWYYDNYYGWVWIPGYTWAPAWVEWRYNNSYIGWSPLPPFADFNASVGIHFTINIRTGYHHWHFVPYGHFHDPYVSHYFVPAREKNFVFNNTKYRTNYGYRNGRVVNHGVSRNYVESRSGSRIREKSINRTTRMNDYTSSRTRNGDRVVAYQPGDREVEKYRNVETRDVKRSASNKTSLKRDMVSFRDRDNTGAANTPDRTTTRNGRVAEQERNTVNPSRRSPVDTQQRTGTRSNEKSKSSTPASAHGSRPTNDRSTYKSKSNNNAAGQNRSTQSNSRSYNNSRSSSNNNSGSLNRSSSSSNSGSRSINKSRRSNSSSQLKKSSNSSSSRKTTKRSSSNRSSRSNSSRSKSSSSRSR